MLIFKFSSDKQNPLVPIGQLAWSQYLEAFDKRDDVRFTLFEGSFKNPRINTIMFDVDGATLLDQYEVIQFARKYFGTVEFFIIYSGRGFHIYVPVGESVTKEKLRGYRQGYYALIKDFQKEGSELNFDTQMINGAKHGRILGSTNSKSGKIVTLISHNDKPLLENYASIFEWQAPPVITPQFQANIPTKGDVLLKNCAFMRWVKDNPDCPYDLWFRAVAICKKRGEQDVAHEVSKGGTNYSAKKIKDIFEDDGSYNYTCGNIRDTMRGSGKPDVCKGCNHLKVGNSPRNITGPNPTPSASSGFHKVTAKGAIDFNSVVVQDVANELMNRVNVPLNATEALRLLAYNGKYYEQVSAHVNDFSKYCDEYRELFDSIPENGITKPADYHAISTIMASTHRIKRISETELNDPNYIGFNNGLYDVKERKLTGFSPEKRVTSIVNMNYSEEYSCDKWLKFLNATVRDQESIELIQAFMGLGLSAIPNSKISAILWLCGAPSTGKSTVQVVLQKILGMTDDVGKGNSVATMPSMSEYKSSDEGIKIDLRDKKVLLIDDFKIKDSRVIRAFEAFINPLASGATLAIKLPYVPPFNISPTATPIITSNDLPPISAASQGLKRRLRLVVFNKMYQDDPSDIIDIVNDPKEIEGIALWAIEGLNRGVTNQEQGKVFLPPIGEEEMKHLEMVSEEASDIVKPFFLEHYLFTDDLEDSIEFKHVLGRFRAANAFIGDKVKDIDIRKDILNILADLGQHTKTAYYYRKTNGMYLRGVRLRNV